MGISMDIKPKEILEKISKALVPQGKMVIQEYYDWSTHQTKPEMPALKYAIAKALESFKKYRFRD